MKRGGEGVKEEEEDKEEEEEKEGKYTMHKSFNKLFWCPVVPFSPQEWHESLRYSYTLYTQFIWCSIQVTSYRIHQLPCLFCRCILQNYLLHSLSKACIVQVLAYTTNVYTKGGSMHLDPLPIQDRLSHMIVLV